MRSPRNPDDTNDAVRLLPTERYDPDDEEWEFKPGTVVRVERRRLSAADAFVFASGCAFIGGAGYPGYCQPGGNGILGLDSSDIFLQSSRVAAGLRSTCSHASQQAPPILLGPLAALTPVAGHAREIHAPVLTREQQTLVLQFDGHPGDQVELLIGDATRFVHRPHRHGVSLVARRTTSTIVPIGTIGGSGTLSWSMPIGDLGASVEASLLHAQAVFRNVQGSELLSSFAELVLLDAAH